MWIDVVEGKRSGTVLYLFFSAPYLCIANIIEVPTRDTSEFEYDLIAVLLVPIETGSISGATLSVVTEACGHTTQAKRQTKARQHCGQKMSIQRIHTSSPWSVEAWLVVVPFSRVVEDMRVSIPPEYGE